MATEKAPSKGNRSFGLILLSALFFAAMMILYALTGTSSFTPTLSTKVLILMGLCVALGMVFTLMQVKNGKYALYLLGLWTWGSFLVSQSSYISNVLVGIDGNQFTIGFLLTTIFGLLALLCALLSAILQPGEVTHRKGGMTK